MKNLLDSTNIGAIFLDNRLHIKRYAREATQIYRLVGSDVGRALNDIKSNIERDDLLADAQAVLDTPAFREREPLIALDGKLKIIPAGRSFYLAFKTTPEETAGRQIL